MRILFLSQWFDPEPFFKALPFAKELAQRGHQVEVLTGFPNYPGGKVYPGYHIKLVAREKMEGVSVIRVPLYPSHDRSACKRILNYLSFALSAGLLGPFLVSKADIAYVYHPPATIGFPAIMLRVLRGIPFVYDIQDLWPESLAVSGMVRSKRVLSLVARWCLMIYRFAAGIVVLSPGLKERLISRGVPSEKIHVIYNWSPDQAPPVLSQSSVTADFSLFDGRFNVVFAGNMGPPQALDSVLVAAEKIRATSPQVQFVFIGSGISVGSLKRTAVNRKLDNVIFLPRVSPAEVGTFLQQADALLVHLKNDPLFAITIPSKTQAYLAAGKPILIGVEGDAADLVETAGAGFAFKPENPDDLMETILRLLSLSSGERKVMGEKGRRFYNQNLSQPAAVSQFEKLFSDLVSKQKRSRMTS